MENPYQLESIDLSSLLSGLDGKWIVLSFDKKKVLAVGDTLKEISHRVSEGSVFRVPNSNMVYAPTAG